MGSECGDDCRNRAMVCIFGTDGPLISMSLQQLNRCPKWVLIEVVFILRQGILSGSIKGTLTFCDGQMLQRNRLF